MDDLKVLGSTFSDAAGIKAMDTNNNVVTLVNSNVYLPLAGGTMTGPLTLASAPSNNLEAATKKYVDESDAAFPVRGALKSGSLNDLTQQGYYYVTSDYVSVVTGKPDQVTVPYNVIHFQSDTERAHQVLFANSASYSHFWTRNHSTSNTWSDWQKVVDGLPRDVTSGFTYTDGTNGTAQNDTAYKVGNVCYFRVRIDNTAAIANNATYTATVSFPTGCTPLMTAQSPGYYNGIALHATLASSGTLTVRNIGTSTLASNHAARFYFVYPCS